MDPDQFARLMEALFESALTDGMPVDGLASLKIDFGADGVKLTATPESGDPYEAEMSAEEVAAALELEMNSDERASSPPPPPNDKPADKPAPAASETQKA